MNYLKNCKALIVDDDLDSLGAMQEYMSYIFGAVDKVDTPQLAIQRFKEISPQVVFVDIRMPKMDGFSLIKKLKEYDKESLFIIVSAYDEKENLFSAIELNVLDYLKKPVTSDNIQKVLKKISDRLKKDDSIIELLNGYRWDNKNKMLTNGDRTILLSTSKTKLFDYLINHKGIAVDGKELFKLLWRDREYNPKSIRSIISKLRKKLPCFIHIKNVYGGKYLMEIMSEPEEIADIIKEHTRFAKYLSIPTVAIDVNYKILYKNRAFENYFRDLPKKDNRCFYHLFGLDCACEECGLYCPKNDILSLKGNKKFTRELKKDGESKLVDIVAVPVKLHNKIVAFILNIHDVTKYKEYQTLAKNDVLTGLYNRYMLEDKIEEAIKRSDRLQTSFALLFIDIDNFKPVNDKYGHNIGDILLKSFAKRLKKTIRESDIAARYGGDEFIVIIDLLKDIKVLDKIVKELQKALNRTYIIEELMFDISCSIGSALYTPGSDKSIKSLIKEADKKMYEAKKSNKSTNATN